MGRGLIGPLGELGMAVLSVTHAHCTVGQTIIYDAKQYTLGWSEFWIDKLDTCHVLPNCLMAPIPKFHFLTVLLIRRRAYNDQELIFKTCLEHLKC